MDRLKQNIDVQFLIDNYFFDTEKIVDVKKGELLIPMSTFNKRLYVVLSGTMAGFVVNPDASRLELFRATRGMFVGVYSFFSESFKSITDVEALTDAKLAYIEADQPEIKNNPGFYREFMPVVVNELIYRQQLAQKINLEREAALKKVIQSEKLASLGQMAAGIAHELNNSISVMQRNSEWLADNFSEILKESSSSGYTAFLTGLSEGRIFSGAQIREKAKELSEKLKISSGTAKKAAQTNLPAEQLSIIAGDENKIDEIYRYWEMGASLRDMKISSRHSVHVVKSVKELGAQRNDINQDVNINEAIDEALVLLKSLTRGIEISSDLRDIPFLKGNPGEFVQIFSNLIKNAAESILGGETGNPEIKIRTFKKNNDIAIEIEDNGPGIPQDILPVIFQPNVTTKKEGLSFGLGIGLTIVQKITGLYLGNIKVSSRPGKTVFKLIFPTEVKNGSV